MCRIKFFRNQNGHDGMSKYIRSCEKKNIGGTIVLLVLPRNIRIYDGWIVNLKKTTSTKMYTPFQSDLINNMAYMRISGTEPSSVILSQTIYFEKLKSDAQKVMKQAEVKRDGVINPQNYNFNKF